ncbi:MAG: kelch repeat-containing protein [Gemmataceae bacterium]
MMTVLLLSIFLAAPPTPDRFERLPVRVASLGACVAGEWLYVYGGHCGKTHTYSTSDVTGRFFRVKLSGGAWEELPSGPIAQGTALVADGNTVIRVGGMQPRNESGTPADNHSLTSVERYDPTTKKWQALPGMPAGRSSHDAVIHEGKLYVVGGWCMQGRGKPSFWHKELYVLDLRAAKLTWKTLPQPFQRRALSAAVVAGKWYVAGGLDASGQPSRRVEVYDFASAKWSCAPELPGDDRLGFSPQLCAVAERLVVSTLDGKVHVLDKDGWQYVKKQEVRRMVHRLVPGGGKRFLVVGGFSSLQDAQRVEEIELP